MDLKRFMPQSSTVLLQQQQNIKRARFEASQTIVGRPISAIGNANNNNMSGQLAVPSTANARTSSLPQPNMLFSGHEAEIFCGAFCPANGGRMFATAGFDRAIFFWDTFGVGDEVNFAVLKGGGGGGYSKGGGGGAILQLQFSTDGATLYSAATDKTLSMWDVATATRIRRFRGHDAILNSCHAARRGPPLVCSGGDDGVLRIWDARSQSGKRPAHTLNEGSGIPVLAVTFNDTAELVYSGGIDNIIKGWDLRKVASSKKSGATAATAQSSSGSGGGDSTGGVVTSSSPAMEQCVQRLAGHTDSITALSLSPDGTHLLSNSMDNTMRAWDIRSFVSGGGAAGGAGTAGGAADQHHRCVRVYTGHQHTFEKNLIRCGWAPDGSRVTSGSGDKFVYVWGAHSTQLSYKLPGHEGSVNETAFHPSVEEPLLLSVGSDKRVFLGEILPSNAQPLC